MLKSINMIAKEEWPVVVQKMWDNCWGKRYLLNVGSEDDPVYLVKDPSQKGQMVSEGMSYGLLLCVTLTKLFPHRAKEFENVFIGLVKGLKKFGGVLPYWKIVNKNGEFVVPDDQKATAADAEVVIAWALLKAEELVKKRIWQKKQEKPYKEQALEMLEEIKNSELKKIPYNWGMRLFLKPSRDWGGLKEVNEVVLNPSYLWLPAFKAFAKHDRKNKKVWQKLYKDSIWLFQSIGKTRDTVFDWAKAKLFPKGHIEFSSLGQGLSFSQTFDGVRSSFILGMDKQKKLCKKFLKNKNIEEAVITPEKPTVLLAQAALLSLACGAKDKGKIKELSDKVISKYSWDDGFFGDSRERDRYYNNTLLMFLLSKVILGA